MDTNILKKTLQHYDKLFKGSIKAQSMFGGYGIFYRDAMFALLFHNHLFIRECPAIKEDLASLGCTPYSYKKRGFLATTRYMILPDDMDDQYRDELMYRAWEASFAQKNVTVESNVRIKDLANLELKFERMLKKIGVTSPEQLAELGAAQAYCSIKSNVNSTISEEALFKLHGAINNVHWSTISHETRDHLRGAVSN
jgi:DNA transformation protein